MRPLWPRLEPEVPPLQPQLTFAARIWCDYCQGRGHSAWFLTLGQQSAHLRPGDRGEAAVPGTQRWGPGGGPGGSPCKARSLLSSTQ